MSFVEKSIILCILANPGICMCKTISLTLQDFACFCRTTLHGSAPRGELRHSEVNSVSNIYHKLKDSDIIVIPAPPWLPLAHSLCNGSEFLFP